MNLDEALSTLGAPKGRAKRVDLFLAWLEADGRQDEADRFRDLLADPAMTNYQLAQVISKMERRKASSCVVRNWRIDSFPEMGW